MNGMLSLDCLLKTSKLRLDLFLDHFMTTLIKAIYKQGVFEPLHLSINLEENQLVQLQIWPAMAEIPLSVEVDEYVALDNELDNDVDNGEEVEGNFEAHPGQHLFALTPEKMAKNREERVQWVHEHWASIALSTDQALEIATADWLLNNT